MWRGGGGGGGGYPKKKPGSGALGSVPPPAYLTTSNAAGKRAVDEAAKRKEEQYAALMYGHSSGASSSGSKSSGRQKRLYEDDGGLDIPEIRTVINYDVARDIDTHVHRIGRTGRAGEKGEAFTLVTEKDKEFAGHLVRNLESVNQPVPEKLMQLAMQAPWFRKSRHEQEGAAGPSSGPTRMGLGFKPRTRSGFGASQASSTPSSASSAFTSAGGARPMAQTTGLPTNRVAALKAAYSTSYKNTFQSASHNELEAGRTPVTDPTPEWKRQFDQTNASLQSSGSAADRKKRSRWE
uniref:ATP-dependent RNA helicase n=1 Tax=Plectus sambesii TaxID=2011161 RepID=A0A914VYR6_9BILA